MKNVPERIRTYSSLVVLSHSVFALPFALSALILAKNYGITSAPSHGPIVTLFLVVGAVVSARTAAMAFNRYLDRHIDAKNPRTNVRELPQGRVRPLSVLVLVLLSSSLFFLCAAFLGTHCLMLSPFVLLVLLGYSATKRFTPLAHFVLGLALALAPGGAWWVLRPIVEPLPLMMMAAVLVWVAGFDIIYSLQDEQFDREHGLHSLPAQLGGARALFVSRALHAIAFLLFLLIGRTVGVNLSYYVGVMFIGALLAYQHSIVHVDDLSKVNRAFFTVNGFVSVWYFLLIAFQFA